MTRFPDWHPRLVAWLTEVARLPFAYGSHDCALFAAGAVAAMTGHDFAAPWRGRYTTLRGGLRVLRAAGFADHVSLAQSVLPPRAPAFAQPGDLAVIGDTPGDRALGVVQGPGVYVLSPSGALALVPRMQAVAALEV